MIEHGGKILNLPIRDDTQGIDLNPGTAYEAVTRTMVEELAEDVKEIRGRIDAIFWLIAGAIVVELVMRVLGVRG
ncbi:MAG: hypothetical protein R2855_00940 [Thermomicrobiales bacterium]